jgi:hypothetical protein
MLMDIYLKNGEIDKAALVAHEVMLQENSDNQLTLAACLVYCMNYLKKLGNEDVIQEEESKEEGEKVCVTKILLNLRNNSESLWKKSIVNNFLFKRKEKSTGIFFAQTIQ